MRPPEPGEALEATVLPVSTVILEEKGVLEEVVARVEQPVQEDWWETIPILLISSAILTQAQGQLMQRQDMESLAVKAGLEVLPALALPSGRVQPEEQAALVALQG